MLSIWTIVTHTSCHINDFQWIHPLSLLVPPDGLSDASVASYLSKGDNVTVKILMDRLVSWNLAELQNSISWRNSNTISRLLTFIFSKYFFLLSRFFRCSGYETCHGEIPTNQVLESRKKKYMIQSKGPDDLEKWRLLKKCIEDDIPFMVASTNLRSSCGWTLLGWNWFPG